MDGRGGSYSVLHIVIYLFSSKTALRPTFIDTIRFTCNFNNIINDNFYLACRRVTPSSLQVVLEIYNTGFNKVMITLENKITAIL